jgi:hypothetical protein
MKSQQIGRKKQARPVGCSWASTRPSRAAVSVPIAERPAGGRLFAKLKKGDIVIAPKLDRLFARRSTRCRLSRISRSAASRCIFSNWAVRAPFGYDLAPEGDIVRLVQNAAEIAKVKRMKAMRKNGASL